MKDDGIGAAFFFVFLMVASFFLGFVSNSSMSMKDCGNFGKTTLLGKVYTCSEMQKKRDK